MIKRFCFLIDHAGLLTNIQKNIYIAKLVTRTE